VQTFYKIVSAFVLNNYITNMGVCFYLQHVQVKVVNVFMIVIVFLRIKTANVSFIRIVRVLTL